MGVSKYRGVSPQIIHFNRVFPYHPFWGFSPYFWKHPYRDCDFSNGNPYEPTSVTGNFEVDDGSPADLEVATEAWPNDGLALVP